MSKARITAPEAGDDPVSGSVLALQPGLLKAFNRLYGTLWSRGVLDHSSKETARLRNARIVNCVFCKSVRFAGAREEGLSEDQVEKITDAYQDSDLSNRQKLILRYTDAFLDYPPKADSELQAAMQAEFSAEEIVELTAGLALFMGFSKIAVSLGGMPDSLPVMAMPTPE